MLVKHDCKDTKKMLKFMQKCSEKRKKTLFIAFFVKIIWWIENNYLNLQRLVQDKENKFIF